MAKVKKLKKKITKLKRKVRQLKKKRNAQVTAHKRPRKKVKPSVSATQSKTPSNAFDRIKQRRKEIDFVRIGRANARDKDDLQLIKGIGPDIEKKLNALSIYKFSQIAKFTTADEKQVNEAIEFFIGRIKRDTWVSQAKRLVK